MKAIEEHTREFIEDTMEANAITVSDHRAVPVKKAILIAMEAAGHAAQAAGRMVIAQKRFEMACHIAGGILSNRPLPSPGDCFDIAGHGLMQVDAILEVISAEKDDEDEDEDDGEGAA